MAQPRNIIGPALRRLRIQRGLSQQELAELLQRKGWDVSRGIVARIEGQVRWLADFELLFLAESLGVSVESLVKSPSASKIATQMVQSLQYGAD